jgi:GMP synthase-like glutamine amidotransferase
MQKEKTMRLHFLQHAPFEDLGIIAGWANDKKIPVSRTAFFLNETLPNIDSFDFLVVMGGPMGVYDEDKYTWLTPEKEFIKEAILAGKAVLGICLGAQLIADVLGAKVYSNSNKEIGWFPVRKNTKSEAKDTHLFHDEFYAFHWHGDTFDLPEGSIPIGESDACKNQGFIYGERVMALQFHLETTPSSVENLIKNCGDELISGPYIQQAEKIREGNKYIPESNWLMYNALDYLESLAI